ncbi:DUF2513 domain-containing protein [Paenibacillus amylolyticus]|nr:DUF2513 domain-containing protein [Paenibacillus amylolyticus]WFR64322.1 DUF2513 domain-containing protein [Paenibacillus amylolyticus]
MKLNPDLIRDILLTVEENTSLTKQMTYEPGSNFELLNNYSPDEVTYHIKQCELSGFFYKVKWFTGLHQIPIIFYLTPAGHEFLSNIRSEQNWSKTKSIAQKVGSVSLDSITKIATSVIASVISSQFK